MTDHSGHDHSGQHPPSGGDDHANHMTMVMTVSKLFGNGIMNGIWIQLIVFLISVPLWIQGENFV